MVSFATENEYLVWGLREITWKMCVSVTRNIFSEFAGIFNSANSANSYLFKVTVETFEKCVNCVQI